MQLLVILITAIIVAFPISVLADSTQLIQHVDIAEIMMKKYSVSIDNTDFTIFYRFSIPGHGEETDEDLDARITSVDINKERKSLVMELDNINHNDILSIRLPSELISTEGKKLTLLIDGNEKGYESSSLDNKSGMIFVLPKNTKQVEIIGTKVIPEFPSGILTLIIILSSVILIQKSRKNL